MLLILIIFQTQMLLKMVEEVEGVEEVEKEEVDFSVSLEITRRYLFIMPSLFSEMAKLSKDLRCS